MKVVLNLDELLTKIHSQVSPKWRQFGLAVRVPVETLDDLSAYQEKDRLSEIADYWMKQHQGQLTWREAARIMKEIGINDLAEEILSDRKLKGSYTSSSRVVSWAKCKSAKACTGRLFNGKVVLV